MTSLFWIGPFIPINVRPWDASFVSICLYSIKSIDTETSQTPAQSCCQYRTIWCMRRYGIGLTCIRWWIRHKSMAVCKRNVTLFLTHWSYVSFSLNQWYLQIIFLVTSHRTPHAKMYGTRLGVFCCGTDRLYRYARVYFYSTRSVVNYDIPNASESTLPTLIVLQRTGCVITSAKGSFTALIIWRRSIKWLVTLGIEYYTYFMAKRTLNLLKITLWSFNTLSYNLRGVDL